MSHDFDPMLSAIQHVTSTFGVEGSPPSDPRQEQLPDYEGVKQLAEFLGDRGCYLLAELPQDLSAAEHAQLRQAQRAVEQYIRTSGDQEAATLSRSAHYFEVAAAPTAEDARALLDKYDYLRPHEDPEERIKRKQGLLDRWGDVQVLRQHAQTDRALAPEVTGPDFQLPSGFEARSVSHSVVDVHYETMDELLRDLSHYRDAMMLNPPENATAEGPGRIRYGQFFTYPNIHGGIELASDDIHQNFGVTAMERFAHVEGRPAGHSTNFGVGIRCPMPPITGQGADARSESLTVPVDGILQTLANVTGLPHLGEAQPIYDGLRYDLPNGGSIQITGENYDYTENTVRASHERYSQTFRAPHVRVQIQLGKGIPDEQLDIVARRFSAWLSAQAGQAGQNPGLPAF